MQTSVECIIAGGPEHGLVLFMRHDSDAAQPPSMHSVDGQLCRSVALRRSPYCGARYVLLHPNASGAQLREILSHIDPGSDELPAHRLKRPQHQRELCLA